MTAPVVLMVLTLGFWASLALAGACMVALVAGPTNLDRLVALDLGMVMSVVSLGLFAAAERSRAYLDAGLILAVLAFLITVEVARLLETGQVFR